MPGGIGGSRNLFGAGPCRRSGGVRPVLGDGSGESGGNLPFTSPGMFFVEQLKVISCGYRYRGPPIRRGYYPDLIRDSCLLTQVHEGVGR